MLREYAELRALRTTTDPDEYKARLTLGIGKSSRLLQIHFKTAVSSFCVLLDCENFKHLAQAMIDTDREEAIKAFGAALISPAAAEREGFEPRPALPGSKELGKPSGGTAVSSTVNAAVRLP